MIHRNLNTVFSLLVSFEVFHPTWEFFTHMETSTLPVKGCKFWSVLGTYGHWAVGVFSMQHLLYHGTFVYNGHLLRPMTLTPITERLAKELSLLLFLRLTCRSVEGGIRTPKVRLAGRTLYQLHNHSGANYIYKLMFKKGWKSFSGYK